MISLWVHFDAVFNWQKTVTKTMGHGFYCCIEYEAYKNNTKIIQNSRSDQRAVAQSPLSLNTPLPATF